MKKHEIFHILIMIYRAIILLFKSKPKETAMEISPALESALKSVASHLITPQSIENVTSTLLTKIINDISAHSAKIAAMNLQADVTPEALDAESQKLISMLSVLNPVLDVVEASYPALVPFITLAQSYESIAKD